MHPNPIYRKTGNVENLEFLQQRAFGTLCVNADPAPLMALIPFLATEDSKYIELHLVRSNPIVRLVKDPRSAVLSVLGPDSYVSPDWYEVDDQVPTWNYVSVQVRGTLEVLPTDKLMGNLDRLSDHFEKQLLPKLPRTTGKMTPEILERMMRMIIPCRLSMDDVQSTWKLGQNKPDDVKLKASQKISGNGIGQEVGALGHLMRNSGHNKMDT